MQWLVGPAPQVDTLSLVDLSKLPGDGRVPQPDQSSMWGSRWHTQVPSDNQPCGQGVRGGRGPTWTSVGFTVSHVLL